MNAPTRTTDGRLEAALDRLVAAGTLTPPQADAVRREYGGAALPPAPISPSDSDRPAWTSILAEVGGYVGAAFVFAAAVAITGPNWDRFSEATKVATLLGPAVLMIVAAVAVAISAPGRWHPLAPADGVRRRLVSALVVVAGLLASGATVVLGSDGGDGTAVLASLTALLVFAAGYAACRSVLLHVALGSAALTQVFATYWWAKGNSTDDEIGIGLLITGLGLLWAALTLTRVLGERTLGLSAAASMGFIGGEVMANDSATGISLLGYAVMGVSAVAALAGYVVLREVALLALGALGLAITVPQAVIDFSDGALGAAGALLISGLSIVGASVLALRLRTAETADAADQAQPSS